MQCKNIICSTQRVYDRAGANYIITVHIGHCHGLESGKFSGYPQAWAAVDDFGTLVMVGSMK